MTSAEILRFRSRVQETATCWHWLGYFSNGYGKITIRKKKMYAHRIAWQLAFGAIPTNRVINHLCENRRCVNPAHLELTTTQGNLLYAYRNNTPCPKGHAYDPDNRVKGEWRGRGSCKQCLRERNLKRYHERKHGRVNAGA